MVTVDRDETLWSDLVALHATVERALAAALADGHGVTLSEYRALRRLAAAPDGELRMQELADAIGLNQSSVTRLVARLERAGLTRRDLCPDDRRGVYTVITAEGRARVTAARATYRSALTGALDGLPDGSPLAAGAAALRRHWPS